MQTKDKKIRVLVVDDSLFMRKVLTDLINSDQRLEVIGTASDGLEAIIRVRDLKPDVVTLDVNMPELDGLRALRRIMKTNPTPIVMVSAYTKKGVPLTLDCLEAGAVDFIQKPAGEVSPDLDALKNDIVEKLTAASKTNLKPVESNKKSLSKSFLQDSTSLSNKIVVIGASTGGPSVVEKIIIGLNPKISVPVVIAQHMPDMFMETFAKRLDSKTKLKVSKAAIGEELLAGHIYIIPGDCNTRIKRIQDKKTTKFVFDFETMSGEKSFIYPSINSLFISASKIFKEGTLGVILTGMGDDGKDGIELIKDFDGTTIAQDEASSLIFGMPKEAIETGSVDEVLNPSQISQAINRFGA